MTHQELLSEIRYKISDLNRILDHLSDSGVVHLIDAEILLEMQRDIYLTTSLLKEKEIPAESQPFSEPAKAGSPEFLVQPEHNSPPVVPVAPEPEIPMEEEAGSGQPTEAPTDTHPAGLDPVEPESEPIPVIVTPSATNISPPRQVVRQPDLFGNGIISEKFKTETPSINDMISPGKADHTLADKINLTSISDIKNVIGINEKFQFINELFEGSGQLYNDAISLLNNCIGIEAARELYADFQTRNNWDPKSKTCQKLKEYIERRYLVS